jgi:hypothetical protein
LTTEIKRSTLWAANLAELLSVTERSTSNSVANSSAAAESEIRRVAFSELPPLLLATRLILSARGGRLGDEDYAVH